MKQIKGVSHLYKPDLCYQKKSHENSRLNASLKNDTIKIIFQRKNNF